MKININYIPILICLITGLWGCSDSDDISHAKTHFTTYKVAVIQPKEMHERLKEVASWAMEQIEHSQINLKEGVSLKLEWYDENSTDLKTTLKQLASDPQVASIIGPYYSSNAEIAARYCKTTNKTLILPIASSTELQRAYAGTGFIWFLSESDITQCEILLMKAIEYKAQKVSLLTQEGSYGDSFINWFAFQAEELGLEVGDIYIYTAESISDKINEIGMSDADVLICAPSNPDDVIHINKAINRFMRDQQSAFPNVLYSDVACSKKLISQADQNDLINMEGITMCNDPSSGFSIAYQMKFNEESLNGEAHFFDAILLLSYGLFEKQYTQKNDLNSALIAVVDGRDTYTISWEQSNMELIFQMLSKGIHPDINGATGSLNFDTKIHTSVTQSIYAFWTYFNQKYILINYMSSDGSKRTESTLAGWNWRTDSLQEFDQEAKDKTYPPLNDKWAVLVATSQGWSNYRHQADVLAMYDLLRRHGYQDSHIILIMQDDIAYNPKNPYQGVVCVTPEQIEQNKNLRKDVEIDYHLNDLKPKDLLNILTGKNSNSLPKVIKATSNDDILLFWSGHGERGGSLNWGEYQSLNNYDAYQIFKEIDRLHQYRKMLVVIEACYSGSVAKYCSGFPGILFITAANAYETSKADIFNEKMGIFMSNGFTRGFQKAIDENSNISLRDLYYKLARSTVGSHVTVYNEKEYGNLYKNSMSDFLN